MKKLLPVLVGLIVVLLCIPAICSADDSGTCGTNIEWYFDSEEGLLTISGSGAMREYSYNSSPWYNYRDSIKRIVISDGVTSLGDYAFFACSNLTSITIPDSVTSIGSCAFQNCSNLTSVTIPDSMTSIGSNAFHNCSSLNEVHLTTTFRIYR